MARSRDGTLSAAPTSRTNPYQLSSKTSALKKLGIDEIALIKDRGNYCAVLIDLETSKLITIIPGRTQVDIKKVLTSWGTEVLEQIEEVSIDLWRGYKTLVMDLIPNVQVVADRFHVTVQVNKQGKSISIRLDTST